MMSAVILGNESEFGMVFGECDVLMEEHTDV